MIAPLALVTTLAGCGGHPSAPAAAAGTPAGTATTSPAPQQHQVLPAPLQRAERLVANLRSYRFAAVETLVTGRPVVTRISGAVVRAQGVFYTLTAGGTRTQVIRVRTATYVRRVPGTWSALRRPRPVVDPTRTLTALLSGLTDVRRSGSGLLYVADLPAAVATASGIPTSGAPARVTVLLDAAGHVTRVSVHTATLAGSRTVAVTLVTSYAGFDAVPALHRPV